jgi:uncharacterized protein (TIGR02145 family)
MHKLLSVFILVFLFGCEKDETIPTPVRTPFVYTDSVADIDGNYYHTVTIGSQVWLAENLRTTRYQNGDTIINHTSSGSWSIVTSSRYCEYNNDADASAIYGNLYNYWAVTDARNICPPGYHIPTYYEWIFLRSYLGSASSDKLREFGSKHWLPTNTSATDEYGFAALPGGWRTESGDYERVRTNGYFWSSTHYIPSSTSYPQGWLMAMSSDTTIATAELVNAFYGTGCSVRCVKD